MGKKKYVAMTVDCEEFQLNQAIAGACNMGPGDTGVVCEDCYDAQNNGRYNLPHTWTVYGDKNWLGEYENGAIGIAESNAPFVEDRTGIVGSNCYSVGHVVTGMAVVMDDGVRAGFFDPCPDNQGPLVIYQGDPTQEGQYAIVNGSLIYNSAS